MEQDAIGFTDVQAQHLDAMTLFFGFADRIQRQSEKQQDQYKKTNETSSRNGFSLLYPQLILVESLLGKFTQKTGKHESRPMPKKQQLSEFPVSFQCRFNAKRTEKTITSAYHHSCFAPHWGQNFAPACRVAPHLMHCCASCLAPQAVQKRAPGVRGCPHAMQRTAAGSA